jgi:hypothetical protein
MTTSVFLIDVLVLVFDSDTEFVMSGPSQVLIRGNRFHPIGAEVLLGAADEQSLVRSIVLHAFICGASFRLKRAIQTRRYSVSHSDKVWFTHRSGICDALVLGPSIRTGRAKQ